MTSPIAGLSPQQSQKIISILTGVAGIRSAIVFGSRAKGNFKPGSDIDIAVIADDLKIDDLRRIEEQYAALYMPWKLDIVDFKRIEKKALIEHIERVGIALF